MLAHSDAPIAWSTTIAMLGVALICHTYVIALRRSRLPKVIRWRNWRPVLYVGDFAWTVTIFYLAFEATHESNIELGNLVLYSWVWLVTWPAFRSAVWETYFR